MHELYELKEKLLRELLEYNQNNKFSKEDAEIMKYLSSAIDHMCNIAMDAEEKGEYSSRSGMSYRGGSYARDGQGGRGGNQGDGSNRGGSYTDGSYIGSYARGRGRNARRDSMGRYSSGDGYSRNEGVEEIVESIRGMMQELPQDVQRDAQKFVQKLEQEMM